MGNGMDVVKWDGLVCHLKHQKKVKIGISTITRTLLPQQTQKIGLRLWTAIFKDGDIDANKR